MLHLLIVQTMVLLLPGLGSGCSLPDRQSRACPLLGSVLAPWLVETPTGLFPLAMPASAA